MMWLVYAFEVLPPELAQMENLYSLEAGLNRITEFSPELCQAQLVVLNLFGNSCLPRRQDQLL